MSSPRPESQYLQGKIFQKVCDIYLTLSGTGKTYASAFAMREMGFQKVLFLVHRNQIAKQALKSFRKVFSGKTSMGMVSGALGRWEYDKDYIFATVQNMSKDENLRKYSSKHFDAIIYDDYKIIGLSQEAA